MRRSTLFGHRPWFIMPQEPGRERGYRRWNLVLISALVFIVMGVFVMTLVPELAHAVAGTHQARAQRVVSAHHGAQSR